MLALPGRMVRLLALSEMKTLKLKQAFVRHVSHEIRSFFLSSSLLSSIHVNLFRSPLNVVLAGLEILISDLSESANKYNDENSQKTLEMAGDVHSACETAIQLLNDLLNYEHLDAGISFAIFNTL